MAVAACPCSTAPCVLLSARASLGSPSVERVALVQAARNVYVFCMCSNNRVMTLYDS